MCRSHFPLQTSRQLFLLVPLQWDEVSVLDDQRRLTRTFEACHVAGVPPGAGQDNWLQTHFVERRGAQRAHIRLHFSVRACSSLGVSGGTCRETFTLYYRQAEEPDSPDSVSAWHLKRWTKVDTIAADESFPASSSSSSWAVGPHRTGQRVGLQLNVKERSFGPLTQRGFYVAFQDTGACLALVAVKLFSYTCPSILRAFASFPETQASGAGGASLVAAVGTCVAHAEPEEDGVGGQAGGSPPRLHCNGEGRWMVAVGGCRCQPGYQPARGDKLCQGESLSCTPLALGFSPEHHKVDFVHKISQASRGKDPFFPQFYFLKMTTDLLVELIWNL